MPVLDPQGRIAAVFDIATPRASDHARERLLLEIVRSGARRIESRFFRRAFRNSLIVRLSADPEFIDAAEESLLAIDANGRIIGADQRARQLLGYPTADGLLGSRADQGASRYDVLARSTDAGRSFTVGDGPCFADLGGALAPSSVNVLWVVCPTGMMAGAARSTDGGVTFAPLHLQKEIPNSTRLAPASDDSALLIIDAGGATPLLTTDAGAHWTAPQTPRAETSWAWAGFTDAETGAALVQTGYDTAARLQLQQLWRTTDGGASWSVVHFR